MTLMESERRVVHLEHGRDEIPWRAQERGTYLRAFGKTWLVELVNVASPGGVTVVLRESTVPEGAEVVEWSGE